MSASFVIPFSALFDEDGDLLVGWETEQKFAADHQYDFRGVLHVSRMTTCLVHHIKVQGELFEVGAVTEKDEDGMEVLTCISFSGFHATCVRLQELLGISVEIH